MNRRTLIILSIIHGLVIAGYIWASFSPAVHAVMVSVEVVQPDPVAGTFTDDMPRTVNPQKTINVEELK